MILNKVHFNKSFQKSLMSLKKASFSYAEMKKMYLCLLPRKSKLQSNLVKAHHVAEESIST